SGIFISTGGAIMTVGAGIPPSVAPAARGLVAVDLQSYRDVASQVASGGAATISGGADNTAAGLYASVPGGFGNLAGGYGSVAGGFGNAARGDESVAFGYMNTAHGAQSVVPGGRENTAYGQYSWAGGYRSSSTADGAFTWSDSEGAEVRNDISDRTVFKSRGGFMVTPLTGALGGNLGMLDIVSTGTAADVYAQVWRNSSGVAVASMTSEGTLYADLAVGDDLGNHVATQGLDMSQFPVLSVSSVTMVGDGIRIATSVYSGASGIFISTAGSIMTTGKGNGTAYPSARGIGAVDLQTYRTSASSVAAGAYSVIAGGRDNRAGGAYSGVVAGQSNLAGMDHAVVSGGGWNRAAGEASVVSGGTYNTAAGDYSTISGGGSNLAGGSGATISGGGDNIASAGNSTI
ncbi:MAG TPA: hypothetical protein PK523_13070, partial [Elusimicrobiales bacterium]|nr:hypothetical protein [Elusimicrobiales bacterium]